MSKRSADISRRSSTAAAGIQEIRKIAAFDPALAIRMARQAGQGGVSDPLIHQLAALDLKRQGRLEDAVLELGRGLALYPHDLSLIFDVGVCMFELGRKLEASRVFATAVQIAPNWPEANFGLAVASEQVGDLQAAEAAFRRTLLLSPSHADSLVGLAGLALRQRDWDLAKSCAEQALAIAPDKTEALMSVARADFGQGRLEAAEAHLGKILASPDRPPDARIAARILLGDVRDGAGRYEEAYAAYCEGKSILRDTYASRFDGAGRRTIPQSVRRIRDEFVASPRDAWTGPVGSVSVGRAPQHVFVVGFLRSGTTLLGQVLAAHPQIVSLDEPPTMVDAEAEFLTRPGGVTRLAAAPDQRLDLLRQAYWRLARDLGADPDGRTLVEKVPLGTIGLPLIQKMFPRAKIIFAVRDPRDVVLSCFRRNMNVSASNYEFISIDRAARFYDAVMQAVTIYLEKLPLDVHRLRYEDLVADFDATSRGLCDFLGLDWTEDMANFAELAKARRLASVSSSQVLRGLYPEGVGQWRNYAFAMGPALETLQPWVESFGYGGSTVRGTSGDIRRGSRHR